MPDYPEFFQEHRIEKRKRLLESGVNPYPYSFSPTHTIAQMIEKFEELEVTEEEVIFVGRLLSQRAMGKSWFMDATDRGNRFQLYVRKGEASDSAVELVQNLDIGDWIGIKARVFRTKTGEPTALVRELTILGKSVADVPFGKVHDGTTSYTLSSIEVRRQQRYLDWITDPDSVKRFELRSKIMSVIRKYMEEEGFIEVETPTLEMVYGGAEARPFKTKVWALGGQDVFMRVSLELPLKRYIIGGFPKVFSINKCFRNEGIDATHNPEFTLMEWYEALTDYEFQMTRYENLTCRVLQECVGSLKINYQGREVDFTTPWERIRIPELIKDIFGCGINEIDRAALEKNIDDGMTDEKTLLCGNHPRPVPQTACG